MLQDFFFKGSTNKGNACFCCLCIGRQNIFVNISNTVLDHTPLKTETAPRPEMTVNSLCFTRTNWEAASCDKKIKLDSLNVSVVLACEVLISCEASDYVCDWALANPMFCFCVCLFVQTGNQHIYQPVGKPGNRQACLSLKSHNHYCFICLLISQSM